MNKVNFSSCDGLAVVQKDERKENGFVVFGDHAMEEIRIHYGSIGHKTMGSSNWVLKFDTILSVTSIGEKHGIL